MRLLGKFSFFRKISLRDNIRTFRFAKSKKGDGFCVTFSLVRKSNQKVHQRAAKRRCRIGFCGKLKLQCGLDAASGRLKGKLHVIFVAVERENWCVPTENLVLKCSLLVYGKLKILLFSTRLFVSYGNCFLFPKKSNSHQTNPFYSPLTYCLPKSNLAFLRYLQIPAQ